MGDIKPFFPYLPPTVYESGKKKKKEVEQPKAQQL